MAAPVTDAAVIRLFGFGANAGDVDFDALVVEVAGIDGEDGSFFFSSRADLSLERDDHMALMVE
jgi:hypothetical protein